MSFWSGLTGFGKDLGRAWTDWWDDEGKQNLAFAYDTALGGALGLSPAHTVKAAADWKGIKEREAGRDPLNSVITHGLGPVAPLLQNVGSTLERIPGSTGVLKALDTGREWAGRGISTFLMAGQQDDRFNPDNWHKAWNESRHISPGQTIASIFGAAENSAFNKGDEELTIDEIVAYNKAQGTDPSKQDGWYRWVSGGLDFGANFIDPSFALGKLAKAKKVKWLYQPLKTVEQQEKYLDSTRLQKVLDLSKTAKSSNELYQKAFTSSTFGGRQADVLFSLRHDEAAQRDAVRAFLGDKDSLDRLKNYNEGAADKIMDAKTREEWAGLKNREEIGSNHVLSLTADERARLKVLDGQRIQSAKDAYLDPDTLDDLRKTLVGQYSPRVGYKAVKKYKAMQQKSIYDRPIAVRLVKSLSLSTDSRIVRQLDLNDEQGITGLRQYLDRTPLDPQVRDKFLSQYIGAPSAEIRGRIAGEVEDAVVKAMADKHGLGDENYKQILATARQGRAAARWEHQQNTRRFITEKLQLETEKKLKNEPEIDLTEIMDADGMVSLSALPILTSQRADVLSLADVDHMNRVFGRQSSKLRKAASLGGYIDKVTDGLDDVNSLWKTTTLLRGGWTVRMLSDEVMRQAMLMGAFKTMAYSARGTANFTYNVVNRARAGIGYALARNKEEETEMLKNIGRPSAATSRKNARRGVAKEGTTVELGARTKYGSMEEAFVNGDLVTEDYIRGIEELAGMSRLPETEARLLSARKQLGETQFRNELFDYALSKIGHDRYANPLWQGEILDQAAGGRRMAVNPFTGDVGDLDVKGLVPAASKAITRNAKGHFEHDDLYDFIAENRDLITYRGSQFGIIPDRSGGLRLAVFTPGKVTRPTSLRGAVFGIQKRSRATQGNIIKGRHGTYELAAALADEKFAKRVSVDGYEGGGAGNMMLGSFSTKVMRTTSAKSWTEFRAADDMAAYGQTWERAVNHQIASDPVAKRILLGEDDDQITAFLESPAARGLRRDKPFFSHNPRAWISTVRTMVDEHVPDLTWTTKTGERSLRSEVLASRARIDDYAKAMRNEGIELPDIHGESIEHVLGTGSLWKDVGKSVNWAMNTLGTVPSEIGSRVPFFDRSYRMHLKSLVQTSDEMAKAAIDPAEYAHLEHVARTHALADVRKWLYNSDSVTTLAHKTRYVTAFMGATQDAMSAWMKIAKDDPSVLVTLGKIWNAPEKAGLIQDGDGNQLQMIDGKEVWFASDRDEKGNLVRLDTSAPENKNVGKGRYIVLKAPNGTPITLFGKDSSFLAKANKDAFNTFVNWNPGAGPLVAASLNEVLIRNKTLIKDDDKFAKWVVEQILPFGVQADTWKTLMSSTMKEGVTAWQGEESTEFNSRTTAIMQTMLFEWARNGKHGEPPSWDVAADRAKNIGTLRLLGALTLPVQFQYKSPYQPYIDAYNLLRRQDPEHADMKFVARYGEEYFYLVGRVSQALPGLPTSVKGQQFFDKNRDLIEKHPELLGLIMGNEGAGEFSKSVYEAQKRESLIPGGEKLRGPRKPEDVVKDAEAKIGWLRYSRFMDAYEADLSERGLRNDRQSGAEDLVEAKRAFLAQNADDNPGWGDDFYTVDMKKNEKQIEGLAAIAQDERFRGRPEIQGLTDYLILREQMRYQLQSRAAEGGASTLEARSNEDLADLWDTVVLDLKNKNPSFGPLHHRWLEKDKF